MGPIGSVVWAASVPIGIVLGLLATAEPPGMMQQAATAGTWAAVLVGLGPVFLAVIRGFYADRSQERQYRLSHDVMVKDLKERMTSMEDKQEDQERKNKILLERNNELTLRYNDMAKAVQEHREMLKQIIVRHPEDRDIRLPPLPGGVSGSQIPVYRPDSGS